MENLDLIDWRMVGFASLWILGLSVVLTALGFADYHAHLEKRRTREVLRRAGYQASIDGGLTLFCLGLLGSARTWWETLLWAVLALAFAYYTVVSLRPRRGIPSAGQGDRADAGRLDD